MKHTFEHCKWCCARLFFKFYIRINEGRSIGADKEEGHICPNYIDYIVTLQMLALPPHRCMQNYANGIKNFI